MTTSTALGQHHDQLRRLRAAMDAPSGRIALVNVPMANFLMLDGRGDAGGDQLSTAVRAVADLSSALRLYLQDGDGTLLDPMPLELLWAAPEDEVWQQASAAEWGWTAMVAQPPRVTPELVVAVRERMGASQDRELLRRIRLGSVREGLCAQTAYAGRADRTSEVLDGLLEHVRSAGYQPHGPHHEIFVADLRHRDVASLRTVVRQPVHRPA